MTSALVSSLGLKTALEQDTCHLESPPSVMASLAPDLQPQVCWRPVSELSGVP